MAKFIVVEIYERDMGHAPVQCDTLEAAVKEANRALEEHCKTIGRKEEFAEFLKNPESHWGDLEQATASNLNAWCNLGGANWDAHIIEV